MQLKIQNFHHWLKSVEKLRPIESCLLINGNWRSSKGNVSDLFLLKTQCPVPPTKHPPTPRWFPRSLRILGFWVKGWQVQITKIPLLPKQQVLCSTTRKVRQLPLPPKQHVSSCEDSDLWVIDQTDRCRQTNNSFRNASAYQPESDKFDLS